jgi:hypothetical protein
VFYATPWISKILGKHRDESRTKRFKIENGIMTAGKGWFIGRFRQNQITI